MRTGLVLYCKVLTLAAVLLIGGRSVCVDPMNSVATHGGALDAMRRFPWTSRHLRIGLPGDASEENRLQDALSP